MQKQDVTIIDKLFFFNKTLFEPVFQKI